MTDPNFWDVYQQPHAAIQGTAKTAHYTLVVDEIFRNKWDRLPTVTPQDPPNRPTPAEYFQVMTNNICYMFGRATRSVSLAPPAYYADLAAERARRLLSRYFDPTSSERGSDNGAAAAAAAAAQNRRLRDVGLHANLGEVMHYI